MKLEAELSGDGGRITGRKEEGREPIGVVMRELLRNIELRALGFYLSVSNKPELNQIEVRVL